MNGADGLNGSPDLSTPKSKLAEKVKRNFDFFVRSAKRAEVEKVRMNVKELAIEIIMRDLQRTGYAAGIDGEMQRRWISANFGHKASLAREYARYAENIGRQKNVDELIVRTIEVPEPDNTDMFLIRAMDTAPLFGLVTASLFEDAKNPESGLNRYLSSVNRPIDKWYPEVVKESANALASIEEIFKSLDGRCKTEDQKKTLKPFLNDWKKQLQLYVMDCVNLLDGYVMHLEKEDCAVLYSSTDFMVAKDRFEPVKSRLMELQKHKVFAPETKKDKVNYCGLFEELAEANQERAAGRRINVHVPTMISAMDVCSLVFFLADFFENIKNGLSANKTLYANSGLGDTAKYVPLTNRNKSKMATLQLRPEEDDKGQARIKFEGNGRFSGFDLRLDRDSADGREQLTMDIGSADLNHALDYAKTLGELSDGHEIVMNYSRIYGKKEAGAPVPKYPSVFEMPMNAGPNGGKKPYTMGNKVALVSAVAMGNATVHGLRNSEIYLHHSRTPEMASHTKNFPKIVEMLAEILLSRGEEKAAARVNTGEGTKAEGITVNEDGAE